MMRSPCSLSRMHAACRVTTCASSASVNDFAPALAETADAATAQAAAVVDALECGRELRPCGAC